MNVIEAKDVDLNFNLYIINAFLVYTDQHQYDV